AQFDFDFHLLLAEATHNFIFVNIVKMTFNLIMATHERIYSLLSDKQAFLNEHRLIYDAIVDHDMAGAAALATRHIDRVYKTLQESLALEVESRQH
ncbi:MAG: GntR domain protein, partial [Synergistales bacterium 53_16]